MKTHYIKLAFTLLATMPNHSRFAILQITVHFL